MSDFFSALAARVVQRQDGAAAPPVRPRLPALFEAAPVGLGEDLGERIDSAPTARLAPGPPPSPDFAPPAASLGRTDDPPAPPRPPPPAEIAPRLAAMGPTGAAPTPTPEPPLAPVGTVRPEAHARPVLPKTTMTEGVEVTGIRPVAKPAALSSPEATRDQPSDGAAPEAVVGARLATPQPLAPAAPALRIAEGAPPRALAPLPPAETTIEVAIGRIEVRAAPAPPERRAAAAGSPVMSLEDYLKSRPGRPGR